MTLTNNQKQEPTNPTQENLDWLAEFCGATVDDSRHKSHPSNDIFLDFPNGEIMPVSSFDPYTVPAHAMMVLDALVEKTAEKEQEDMATAWSWVLTVLGEEMIIGHEKNYFFRAVCEAALISRKDEG